MCVCDETHVVCMSLTHCKKNNKNENIFLFSFFFKVKICFCCAFGRQLEKEPIHFYICMYRLFLLLSS